MSIEAVSVALSADVGSSTRKLVLIGYANHAHRDGTTAYPSKATVAEYANCDAKTVGRHVKALVALGWLRPGDQRHVAHQRADKRTVVYDIALDEPTRARWAAAQTPGEVLARQSATAPADADAAARDDADTTPAERGDTMTPRHGERRDNLSPRPQTSGGTSQHQRGDTAVSPEPSLNQKTPQPPSKLGGRRCAKHPHTPGDCCRGCGTTPRQIEDQRRADAAARRKATEAAAAAAAKAAAEQTRIDTATPIGRDRLAQVRAAVRRSV